jgi:hypothetical protein
MARETRTDADSIDIAYGPNLFPNLRLRLSDSYLRAFEIQKDFLRDHKLIDGDVDLDRWVLHQPLRDAERLLATRGPRSTARAA